MTEVVARHARLRELLPLSWGSAEAFCRHRPLWARVLLPVSWLLRVPSYVGWILAGEVWSVGRATSVVMTPGRGVRSKLITATALLVSFLVLLGVFLGAASLPGIASLWAVVVVGVALALFAVAAVLEAVWLVSITRRTPGSREAHKRPSPVLLHDLARGSADEQGIGVPLLGAMLREPTFAASTVIAIAATEALASDYCAEGMEPVLPGSRVLVRAPLSAV